MHEQGTFSFIRSHHIQRELHLHLHHRQIIPAFVREAYALLRQSIIHVEQDDIDFDDEEDNGLNGGPSGGSGGGGGGGGGGPPHTDGDDAMNLIGEDDEFSQAELEAVAKAESSYQQQQSSEQIDSNQDSMLAQAGSLPRGVTSSSSARRGTSTAAGVTSTSSVAGRASSRQPASTLPPPPAAPAPAQQQQQPAKHKLKITYDQYMSIQTLILLHLAECERTTGKGLDREDLIDWYLEQKEKDINTPEELEYETELIGKVLNKLVKVRSIRSFMSWASAYPCFTTRITRC